MKDQADFLNSESACHINTNLAAFNMSSIASQTGGSNNNTDEELFYYKGDQGGELLMNLCNAPINKDSGLSVLDNVGEDIKSKLGD